MYAGSKIWMTLSIDAAMRSAALSARCAILVAALAAAFAADAAELRVLSSGAPSEIVKHLAAKFAGESGHRILVTAANPAAILQRLSGGETPDIVVAPVPVVDSLAKSGTLLPGSRIDLARVGVGVVVRAGAPHPEISTAEAVRRMLAGARSIVYPDPAGGGQTGAALARMIDRMGLAEIVKPKLTLRQAIAGGVALVADGEAEIGLFNISEVLPVGGVALVGPLPPELQSYIVFAAAIHARSTSPVPARALIDAMSDPAAREQWKAGGLESVRGGS
jgi:molybdate transport system substrate-binding protein